MTRRQTQAEDETLITLTPSQVAAVIRQAAAFNGVAAVLAGLEAQPIFRRALEETIGERGVARTLLFGLLLLASFPAGGESRALTDIADEHGIAPGTAHRYAQTFVRVGLLEQVPGRRYRRPLALSVPS